MIIIIVMVWTGYVSLILCYKMYNFGKAIIFMVWTGYVSLII